MHYFRNFIKKLHQFEKFALLRFLSIFSLKKTHL